MDFPKKFTTCGTHSALIRVGGMSVSGAGAVMPTVSIITLEEVAAKMRGANRLILSLTQSPSTTNYVTYPDMVLIKEIADGSKELMKHLDVLFDSMAIALLEKTRNSSGFTKRRIRK